MNVVDYVKSRVEEGDPDFDLDWETAREIANSEAWALKEAEAAAPYEGDMPFHAKRGEGRFSVGVRRAMQDIADGRDVGIVHNPEYGDIEYGIGRFGKRGYGFAHIVESRMAKDGDTLDGAIDVAFRGGEAAERGEETASKRNTRWLDFKGTRAIIALTDRGIPIITGYEIRADESHVAYPATSDRLSRPPARKDEIVAALKSKLASLPTSDNIPQTAPGAQGGAKFSAKRDAAEKREYDEVVSRFTNADGSKKQGWMKAPNGKPTRLTERQWVQVRTPAFKAWFGDWESDPANASKVVDENGEPKVVYHGSRRAGFSVFDDAAGEKASDAPDGTSWFSDSPEVARSYSGARGEVREYGEDALDRGDPGNYACFLNIRSPYGADFEGQSWTGDTHGKFALFDTTETDEWTEQVYPEDGRSFFDSREEAEAFAEKRGIERFEIQEDPYLGFSSNSTVREAMEMGLDGAILSNIDDNGGKSFGDVATDYIAFSPAQIKSATDNTGAFDAENPDIRFSARRQEGGGANAEKGVVFRVNPRLNEDISRAVNGDADGKPVGRRSEVEFSSMPDTLKAVGIPDLPIRTRTDIVRKLKREHRFTEPQIAALPMAYGQPAAVFADGRAFVVLTEMQVATRKGVKKPVMVVLRENVDRNGRHEFLASAYPREEANENFYRWLAKSGGMMFLDKNKVAVIGLSGRTISTLNKQADGNRVKTPEDLSSLVSPDIIANHGTDAQGGLKFSIGRVNASELPGSDIFVFKPKVESLPGGTRVADAPENMGERSNYGLTASRELMDATTTPLSQLGRLNPMSLPVSEMLVLWKHLTGSVKGPAVKAQLPGFSKRSRGGARRVRARGAARGIHDVLFENGQRTAQRRCQVLGFSHESSQINTNQICRDWCSFVANNFSTFPLFHFSTHAAKT